MTEPDPFDFVTWSDDPDAPPSGDPAAPPGRPTTYKGKPIPANAMWEDDGVTLKLTPTGRIRRSRGPRPTSGKVTPGKIPAVDLARLESDLTDVWAKAAVALQFQMPTAAMVCAHRGEPTSRAMVQVASRSPRMLAALQKASTAAPVTDLFLTGVMLVAAIGLDTGRTPITSPIAVITGVAEMHRQVNPDAGAEQTYAPPPFMPEGPMSASPPFTAKDKPGDIMDPEHARYSFAAGAGAGSVPFNGMVPPSPSPVPR